MIDFAGSPTMRMPLQYCCNCEGLSGLDIRRCQVAALPTLLGGERVWLTLPLPFCQRCLPCATRPWPKRSTLVVLAVLLGFGSMTACGLLLQALVDPAGSFGAYILAAFLLGPALLFGTLRALHPERPQTSYFCPVRIDLRTGLRGTMIKRMRLHFSNPHYAKAFARLNAEQLRSGFVEVSGLPV